MAHKPNQWWPEAKRIEVVTSYLVLGKSPLVEQVTGVPAATIRQWKTQPWWDELVNQIQREDDQELDANLAKKIHKVLSIVEDRLENGDFILDSKTGTIIRKPVNLKDSWRVGKDMVDVRQILRNKPKEQVNQEAIADILKTLATEFATMARKRIKVLEEVVVDETSELSLRVRQLPGSTNPEETTSHAEQGTSNVGTSGVS